MNGHVIIIKEKEAINLRVGRAWEEFMGGYLEDLEGGQGTGTRDVILF